MVFAGCLYRAMKEGKKEEQGGGQPLICNPSSAASDREREGEGEEQSRVGDRGREEQKKCGAGRKWEIVSPRTSIMFFLSLAPADRAAPALLKE